VSLNNPKTQLRCLQFIL